MSSTVIPTPVLPSHRPGLGALSRILWLWVRHQISAQVVAAGFTDLKPAHVTVFRYPTLEGMRPSELADEMQITKQSVNELLGHLEARGYLVRERDPADSRSRRIRLTDRGHQLDQLVAVMAANADQSAAELLGQERFQEFRRSLADLVARITTSEEERSRT
jgi:DNA-binding MarR family transcriptional regulator